MELTDQEREAITQAIFSGKKIKAIKHYRTATNVGLKQAKEFVEALTKELRQEYPDRVPPPPKGCGTSVLALTLLLGLLGILLR
jgi:hypothetical protein